MKRTRINFIDAASMADWAPLRDRIELSVLFMATVAAGDAVLSTRGVPFAGTTPFFALNGVAFGVLWVSGRITLRSVPRWILMAMAWNLVSSAVTVQVSQWTAAPVAVHEVSSR